MFRTLLLLLLAAVTASATALVTIVADCYRPDLRPIGWTRDGGLLFTHQQIYGIWDGYTTTCGGSGLYLLPAGAKRPRRVVAGGEWCSRMTEWAALVADPERGAVFLARRARPGRRCDALHRLDVETKRWTARPVCGAWFAPMLVLRDGTVAGSLACAPGIDDGAEGAAVLPCRSDESGIAALQANGTARWMAADVPWERALALSPDGGALAATAGRRGIEILDFASGGRVAVSDAADSPAWSPDGGFLAFITRDFRAAATIRVVARNGSEVRTIFVTEGHRLIPVGMAGTVEGTPSRGLVWSPDGRSLVFARTYAGGESLWRVNVDGTGLRRIVKPIRQRL